MASPQETRASEGVDTGKLDRLIVESSASGGAERANYQLFVMGLCEALGLGRPQMASAENARNDYVFERQIDFRHPDGSTTPGWIDCYKRGAFILEAKQSAKRGPVRASADPDQLSMLGADEAKKEVI